MLEIDSKVAVKVGVVVFVLGVRGCAFKDCLIIV